MLTLSIDVYKERYIGAYASKNKFWELDAHMRHGGATGIEGRGRCRGAGDAGR